MQKTYNHRHYPYIQSGAQRRGETKYHEVIVVGGGMVGLTAALDLAWRGLSVVVLDDNNLVSTGSRAICHAQRSLEIWDRIGCAQPLIEKGVSWSVGKVFNRDQLAYQFDLLPESGYKMPGMINLQQYYVEEALVDAINSNDKIDLRWKHKVIGVASHEDHAIVQVETPDGVFSMKAGWLLACDGAGSGIRNQLGIPLTGQSFQDSFLISDVVMKAEFPSERWFWFKPPFHSGQSALLHKQADDVWRIDFQLGKNTDEAEAQKPENIVPRLKAMLGDDCDFELEWVSIYQFACQRAERFRHQRVLLVGDSAHQVSPFGARGGNSGVQDADNLCWKLKLVIDGEAPDSLIDSYHEERGYAADDNLLQSSRTCDFMSPQGRADQRTRDAVLDLAQKYEFARPLVNSGRLSKASTYPGSSLNTIGQNTEGLLAPGTPCPDAPIKIGARSDWLLNQLGQAFSLLVLGDVADLPQIEGDSGLRTLVCGRDFQDSEGLLRQRYDAKCAQNTATIAVYLVRPDQYIAACWRAPDAQAIQSALARAKGL